MRRIVVLASALAVVSVAGLIYAQSSGAVTSGAPTRLGLNAITTYTRGTSKTLQYITQAVGGGNTVVEPIGAGQDIDVSSATLHVHAGPGEVFQSWARVAFDGSGEEFPIQFHSTGTQTIHLTFDPPIPIREGDRILLGPLSGSSPNTVSHTLILNGIDATPPPEVMATDSIKVE